MPITSLFILNLEGYTLFAKHYEYSSLEDARLFERSVFRHTKNYINTVVNCVTIADVHVVFQIMGELLLIITGKDEQDELLLSEILVVLKELLSEHLDNKLTESNLLLADNYGKVSVSCEEMISDGIVETLDVDIITKMTKLKNFV